MTTIISDFNAVDEIIHICNWIKDYFSVNGPGCNAIIGISGGKDSTIAAALLVKALGKDRVIGVQMPNGEQHDIDISNEVISFLGIKSINIDISEACDALYSAISWGGCTENPKITTNTPARLRMTTLYAIAAMYNGRVVNTCNYSEDFVGYSTKFGDAAGDFGFLKNYTVTEVKLIGRALGLPDKFINKIPEDGMCGKSDEDNLGFSYDVLDDLLINTVYPSAEIYEKIEQMHKRAEHKEKRMPVCPLGKSAKKNRRKRLCYDWDF